VASETIFENPPTGGDENNPTEVYNYIESYEPVFLTCNHSSLDAFVPGYYEWVHINSLAYVDSEDSYYVMSRWLDSVQKINRATGTQEWQINGKFGSFTNPDGSNPWRSLGDTDLWSHGHMSQVWADGMLIFDNGDHRTEEVSRVVEYAIDESTQTIEEVWEYVHPNEQFSLLLGDARRLENGNTLIAWSGFGTVQEVTPAGETAWQLQTGVGAVVSRLTWIDDLYAR
jgi:Arylsulfotransferase (ASST).